MKLALSTLALASHIWTGSGHSYSPDGKELGGYKVEVVSTASGANDLETVTTITADDGTKKVITQKLKLGQDKWSDSSNLGEGGGACYGDGLCQNYLADAHGMAYATTIVHNGPDHQRQLTTVLENGKAIKVLRQNLDRVQ